MFADIFGWHREGHVSSGGDFDIHNLVHLVIEIIIVGAILWLLWWLIDFFALPAPFNKVAKGIVAIVGVLFLINLLLGFV